MIAPLEARGAVAFGLPPGVAAAKRGAVCLLLIGLLTALTSAAIAGPFIWDEDGDHIDDRMEIVNLLGYQFAFEQGDTLLRKRIDVSQVGTIMVYSVNVIFDHPPDSSDLAAITVLGMPILYRFESAPAIRSAATFVQAETVAAMPGVERVEAVPILYPQVRDATAAIGGRDPTGQAFPNWAVSGGGDGSGVVIAFLDSGINDAPDGGFPGHESLLGRCLGGASFVHADSSLNTPRDGSENPVDRGGGVTQSHGTHVASLALGAGGESGYAMGVAPAARFVDVKVLNDLGVGTSVAEALDWCMHNRARDWGGPEGYEGIDAINLSISSVDRTDGNDLASQLADHAAELGIVVVASMGNDGKEGYAPSPAAGDRVLAVCALDDQRTPTGDDDLFADFNNYGPRDADGDADVLDEQKPDLLAPGVAVLGADGSLSSDGAQYQRLSGTSMAAALVSGAVAAVRSSYPSLGPAEIAELVHATAVRQLAQAPAGQAGADPRWRSSIGFGGLDLYGVRLEMEQPDRSQVVRLELGTSLPDRVIAVLRTQREFGATEFVFERAPDVNGAPGAFTPYDSVQPVGNSSLMDPVNRQSYTRNWTVPEAERAAAFWYRIAYVEGATRYETPARRVTSPSGPSAATLEVTIVHNAYDHDVSGQIVAGGEQLGLGMSASTSGPVFSLPASSAAHSTDWVTGLGATGNVSWTFRIEVPAGVADSYLPPGPSHPWRLLVTEGGYLNRSGRIQDFRLIWHGQGGDQTFLGGPVPRQTLEGGTVSAVVPQGLVSVGGEPASSGLRFGPNPVRAGTAVTFVRGLAPRGDLSVFDLSGRVIGSARFDPWEGGYRARWEARDAAGQPLPSGVYFARPGSGPGTRLVVLHE